MNLHCRIKFFRDIGNQSRLVRLVPELPAEILQYEAGQYATIERERDRLVKIYSIASAPSETRSRGYLEFYIAGEVKPAESKDGTFEFFFDDLTHGKYVVKQVGGDFVLKRHRKGHSAIVMIATGTGIAPFRSMIHEVYADPKGWKGIRFALMHSQRTEKEFAYDDGFRAIMLDAKIDFCYAPSITRPGGKSTIAMFNTGRVSNLLELALSSGSRSYSFGAASFASPETGQRLADMMRSPDTLVMVCGNEKMVEEVRSIAKHHHIACVSESRDDG